VGSDPNRSNKKSIYKLLDNLHFVANRRKMPSMDERVRPDDNVEGHGEISVSERLEHRMRS
jgi:hypothetical protein